MKYVSTRGQVSPRDFEETLFGGLAEDGGLYLPIELPYLKPDTLHSLADLTYPELATRLLHPFVGEHIPLDDFYTINQDTYSVFNSQPPLCQLREDLFLLELFHGPTFAFKDYALQFIARLFDYFVKKNQKQLLILGATSGDTGSAAIEAFKHYPNVKIVILHPHGKISELQRKQMTTVACDNVWNLAVEGNFDDCQKLVKQCFQNQSFLSNTNLTAINSINWGRIMAQIVYYFSSFLQTGGKGEYVYCVPTGNFGNIFSGYLAMKMGLPIKKFVLACNANNILDRFFSHNDYSVSSLKQTLSPSMDILISSNLERLLYEVHHPFNSQNSYSQDSFSANTNQQVGEKVRTLIQDLQSTGKFKLDNESWGKVKKSFLSHTIDDQQTLEEIKATYQEHQVVIDPHTAVGMASLKALEKKSLFDPKDTKIVLATAHPGKFFNAIDSAIGDAIPDRSIKGSTKSSTKGSPNIVPEKLKSLQDKKEDFIVFPNHLEELKNFLTKKVLA